MREAEPAPDAELEAELVARRPVPNAGMRGALRRRLLAERPGAHRPAHLWRLAGAAWLGAAALLGLAANQVL